MTLRDPIYMRGLRMPGGGDLPFSVCKHVSSSRGCCLHVPYLVESVRVIFGGRLEDFLGNVQKTSDFWQGAVVVFSWVALTEGLVVAKAKRACLGR